MSYDILTFTSLEIMKYYDIMYDTNAYQHIPRACLLKRFKK